MNWDKLLSDVRLGREKRAASGKDKVRTRFQVDYDRIVFSPAFRRLQNKTQVFPLPKSDFVRNRLTHSLETASVGRSLGNTVGEKLLGKYKRLKDEYLFSDFGALVSAACLAHDIGNPPFGHAGEDAISSYFRSEKALPYLSGLNDIQKTDLQKFEGNAAGFRILSQTPASQSSNEGGLNLCYSTYASFVKYPKPSFPDLKSSGIASFKKYNFFYPEIEIFSRIAEQLELGSYEEKGTKIYNRYPLAYLVEAADDICYTIIDFEDGFQMGLISFEEIEEALMTIIHSENIDFKRYAQLFSPDVKIAYLRSKAINTLVQSTAEAFYAFESDILLGKFKDSLLDHIPQNQVVDYIKKSSFEEIYSSESILKIEAAGYKVLPGLLDILVQSVFNDSEKFNKKLRKLIPDEYLDKDREVFGDAYTNLLNITMYVGSMTDQHAIALYRDLNGISLSGV